MFLLHNHLSFLDLFMLIYFITLYSFIKIVLSILDKYLKSLVLLFLWLVSLGINPCSECWWAVFWDYNYLCVFQFWFECSFWIFSFCFCYYFVFSSFSVFFLPHWKVLQLSLSKSSGLIEIEDSGPLWCW